MKTPVLNTLLVQRIETSLGVPLTQHTQLAPSGRVHAVLPTRTASEVTIIESATAKQVFVDRLAAKTGTARVTADRTNGPLLSVGSASLTASSLPQSAQTHLSGIGKLLAALFDQFPQGAGPLTSVQPLFVSAALALRAQSALAPAQPREKSSDTSTETSPLNVLSSPLTRALMLVLKNQITCSGLFYESHLLRQFQRHSASLPQLHEEPQRDQPLPSSQEKDIDESLRPVVRQQLDILSGQPLQWQGHIWPGAPMRWEIDVPTVYDENEDTAQSQDESNSAPFDTRLELELPALGEVNVRIRLRGTHVDIHLEVHDRGAVIQERLSGLTRLISDLGLTPASITANKLDGSHV